MFSFTCYSMLLTLFLQSNHGDFSSIRGQNSNMRNKTGARASIRVRVRVRLAVNRV